MGWVGAGFGLVCSVGLGRVSAPLGCASVVFHFFVCVLGCCVCFLHWLLCVAVWGWVAVGIVIVSIAAVAVVVSIVVAVHWCGSCLEGEGWGHVGGAGTGPPMALRARGPVTSGAIGTTPRLACLRACLFYELV